LYTSPHLVDVRERIQVNGEMIAGDRMAALIEDVRRAVGHLPEPTFFEFMTAMAFRHFADAQVEIGVIEVGLGGRFDATNVLTPLVAGITTIGLDHQEHLGGTVEAIAFEKAGIIKPGVPVVTGRLRPEAATVIERVAGERGAPVIRLGHEFLVAGESTERLDYAGPRASYDDLSCALVGRHQLDNAACAIALLEQAAGQGVAVPESAVREGLRTVRWPGRLEAVDINPLVLLDGAHNPDAASVLAAHLAGMRRNRPGRRIILVLGMMRDKDHAGFLDPLLPFVDDVIVTKSRGARAATVEEMGALLRRRGRAAHLIADPAGALALAGRMAGPDDGILVTGSLFLVGEIAALLQGSAVSPLRG
jgi:dihydrofolate synthase/folylpolyglutamate synthase